MNLLLAEDIPSENKGEAAILFGLIESLKPFSKVKIFILSSQKSDIKNYEHTNCKVILVSKPLKKIKKVKKFIKNIIFLIIIALSERLFGKEYILKICKSEFYSSFAEADIVLIGHDNVFAYGAPSILQYLPIIIYSKLSKKKIISCGASIGPFIRGSKILRYLSIHFILSQLDLITTRDAQSLNYLNMIGVKKPRIECLTDLAFLMESECSNKIDEYIKNKKAAEQENIISITACRFLSEQIKFIDGKKLKDSKEKYEAYIYMLSSVIDWLIDCKKMTVFLIAHVISSDRYIDDRIVNNDIYRKIKRQNKKSVILVNEDLSAPLLKGIISRTKLLLGSRTHSMIAATSKNVPIIAFSDKRRYKTNGILGDQLGQKEYILDIENVTIEKVKILICKALKNHESIKNILNERVGIAKENAKKNGRIIKEIF